MQNQIQQQSVKQWWLSLTAGIVYIAIGTWVLMNPVKSFLALMNIFIIGFTIIGVINVFYAINNRKILEHWGWALMAGLIDLAIALVLLTTPEISMFVLPLYVGFVLMFRSIIGIGFSTYLAHYKVRNWGVVLTLSVLGVIFSLMMIWNPVFGAFTLTLYTAAALLSVGFSQIGMAYELRRYQKLFEREEEELL